MAEDTKPIELTGSAGEAPGPAAPSSGGDETTARHEGTESPPNVTTTKPGEPSEKTAEIQSQAARAADIEAKSTLLTPYWEKWKCFQFDHLDLNKAVALSCNLNPDLFFFDQSKEDDPYEDVNVNIAEYSVRLGIAGDQAGDGLPARRVPERDGSTTIQVRLGVFASWVKKKREQSPEIWEGVPTELVKLAIDEPPPAWPWRTDYTTPKLNALNAAVEEFWKDYHEGISLQKDRSTRAVTKFLVEKRGMGTNVAASIDNIIRPQKWGSGVREGRGFPKGKTSERSP
jgi:hypothetical protein